MYRLPPKEGEQLILFDELEYQLDKLLGWELITQTARDKEEVKSFVYCDGDEVVPCYVVGYIPYQNTKVNRDTVVIQVQEGLHKIMPEHLKEMQVGNSSKVKQVANTLELKQVANTLESIPVEVKQSSLFEMLQEEKPEQKPTPKHKEYDFVAIDFETANQSMDSACSIGIVAVENNEIVETKYVLIKPPTNQFDAKNIEIHGITYEQVSAEPTFGEVWKELEPYLTSSLLVAHNARFDMSVLKCCLERYNIATPDVQYVCSIPVSTYAFKGQRVGNSLGERTKKLGISLENAHHALDDAVACAELVTKTLEINQKTSLHRMLTKYRNIDVKELRDLKPQRTFGSKPSRSNTRFKNNVRIADIKPTVDSIDQSNLVYDKAFVFTGDMQDISRKEAMQKVVNLGGVVKGSVSRKIHYVVVGKQDVNLVGDQGISSKEKKARELIQQGLGIKIIDEKKFMALMK